VNNLERPFLSVGITTYNRKDLLKRCIETLLVQEFTDFEILVGNDYIAEPLTNESIGISDKRVKIINHPVNLGERENLNSLLQHAKGKFFTWQFDDDYYAQGFLRQVTFLLQQNPEVKVVFTSYAKVFDTKQTLSGRNTQQMLGQVLSGKDFLRSYLNGEIKAMGLTAVYDTSFLKKIGGAVQLCNGRYALFAEYLLLVKCQKQAQVGYINEPCIYYYIHQNSWSNVNSELQIYEEAGLNLLKESDKELMQGDDWEDNMYKLIKFVLHEYAKKAAIQKGFTGMTEIKNFYSQVMQTFPEIKKLERNSFIPWSIVPYLKTKMKMNFPDAIQRPLLRIHAKFQ
jgi:glycosyltransferase involved in cell wall biosynthesis